MGNGQIDGSRDTTWCVFIVKKLYTLSNSWLKNVRDRENTGVGNAVIIHAEVDSWY